MLDSLLAVPGRLYVVATLLPLLAFVVLLIAGTLRSLSRPFRDTSRLGSLLFRGLGGQKPIRTGGFLVLAAMAASATLALTGLSLFLSDPAHQTHDGPKLAARWSERVDWVRIGTQASAPPAVFDKQREENPDRPVPRPALALELGYRIDHLTALMFAMVTVVGTAIVLFSLGYMNGETKPTVEDDEVDKQSPVPTTNEHSGHFQRRGRFGRFFLFLSLFAFAMLNLLIADNLFQIFVGWELVGVCSFFLIGFYYERPSASRAANKAFIMNRVGDAGFLIAVMIAWANFGTLNIEELNRRVRSPVEDSHGKLELANQFVRVNPNEAPNTNGNKGYSLPAAGQPAGSHLVLFPATWPEPDHFHGLGHTRHNDQGFEVPREPTITDYGVMPYGLFLAMGLGLFLGCVGKSAQIPLHTWLPDAMEGPTPVSALIHAATMVAAGVYLVGRCFTLFAPEVLLVIAYTGAVTLFVSATIALVMTDIKRVLAYSTVSQLGYMMLSLGIGGWVAGLLHLLTHAFFKALLFLGSGSVIHGCHHEQDLRKMGGLGTKMRITAGTMLVGVLAIVGTPFFSGWYSKDQMLQSALGYGLAHPEHLALFVLPAVTAAMTGFYMFRLWFLAFAGSPRDTHVHDNAHESHGTMTAPLLFLAACSLGIAWGWPPWEADASYLSKLLHQAEPPVVAQDFAAARFEAHKHHLLAGLLALGAAILGAGLAAAMYWRPFINPAAIRMKAKSLYTFLTRKWYFDELYDRVFVRSTLGLARLAGMFDKRPTDREDAPPRRFDALTLDGWLNAVGDATTTAGRSLRRAQTGRIRGYVLVLALTAAAMLGILTVLAS